MKVLPATLGASDEHYRRLGVSRDRIELWEDGMRTDGGKGTYEWWYVDAYLNDGSKLAITFRTKPIIDVGQTQKIYGLLPNPKSAPHFHGGGRSACP
jgi:hypothetical protein